jgi:transcriptional pleiotropic regulator of transition state genes
MRGTKGGKSMARIGITRYLDTLGRITIPKHLRDALSLKPGDAVEWFIEQNQIIMRKYTRVCTFCGEPTANAFHGNNVCQECVEQITKQGGTD